MANLRRQLLINRPFQLRVIGYALGMAALIIGVVYAANYFFFRRFLAMGSTIGLPQGHVFFQFIAAQQRAMTWLFIVAAVLASGVVIFGCLLLSHRVAGPLYRLRRHMEELAKPGVVPTDVRFRAKDYFPELADTFNRMMKRFHP